MGKLTSKIVKIKKIQKVGENLMILIPKTWINELDWNRTTRLVLEFLPHRKMIILSEKICEELNDVEIEPHFPVEASSEPIPPKPLNSSESGPPVSLNDEEISDIVEVPD